MSRCNAFGSNSNTNNDYFGGTGDVTLTANPFTNPTTGDFSLNTAAGGGALCKGTGYPSTWLGLTMVGSMNIGAWQNSGASSGAGITGAIY
jgi:hypothetical protein